MVLSNDLISQFVKATKDDKQTKTEKTVYGTIVESNGAKYVRFDGAAENQLTPAIMEVDAENGERVSVLIKDHSAIVTGNLTKPAAKLETVEIVTENVEAQNAKISKIEADNVTINETLTAHKASMQEIEAENVKISEELTAANAEIERLETEKLSAEQADVKYANIDFANIGAAAIEKLFTESGIIADLVMSEGHVTGKLVGVTIIGDLIEGGTVKADKLVILGTDGLYYKLNTNGVTTTAEQTDYNSLNGKIITAKSITAEKINVDDLVAFGATIGGFHITEDSIYSGAKASVDNTTRGIYQDTDGQFAIGDASNFLKFYKDTDGTYKLAISASTIMFGDSGKSVEKAIEEIQNGVESIGGRNLLKCTDDLPIAETLNSSIGISKFSSDSGTLETTDDGVKLIFDGQFNTSISVPLVYDGCVENGEKLTLSFVYRGNIESFGQIYFLQRTTPNVSISSSIFPAMALSETEWQRYEVTFVAENANVRTNYQVLLFVGNVIYDSSHWIEIKAGSLKLEKGNKATYWTPAPEDVYEEIDNASKTAKNFLEYDATNGLQIGNKTSGSWRGFRTQITNSAFRILSSAGTVLASYGEKLIELGKNATDAVIKLCGGKGQIEYVTDEDSGTDYIQMSSDRVRVKSSKMSSVYSMYTDNTTRWEKSAVNVSPNKVELYASECIDPGAPDHIDSWQTTKATIESGNVTIDTPGRTTFNGEGVYDEHGKLMSVIRGSSGIWSYSKWSDGTVDLWGTYHVYDQACTAALGSMYRTLVFQPDSFPFLVYNPQLVASYETTGYGAILWATTTTTTSGPPSYYLLRPVSGTITYGKIIFHVTGTWV